MLLTNMQQRMQTEHVVRQMHLSGGMAGIPPADIGLISHLEGVLTLLAHDVLRSRMHQPQTTAEMHVVRAKSEGLGAAGHDASLRHELVRSRAIICAAIAAEHRIVDDVESDRIKEFVLVHGVASALTGAGKLLWRQQAPRLCCKRGFHLYKCIHTPSDDQHGRQGIYT